VPRPAAGVDQASCVQSLRNNQVKKVAEGIDSYVTLIVAIGSGIGAGLLALSLIGLLGAAFLVRSTDARNGETCMCIPCRARHVCLRRTAPSQRGRAL
jgi:hypothetical protein